MKSGQLSSVMSGSSTSKRVPRWPWASSAMVSVSRATVMLPLSFMIWYSSPVTTHGSTPRKPAMTVHGRTARASPHASR